MVGRFLNRAGVGIYLLPLIETQVAVHLQSRCRPLAPALGRSELAPQRTLVTSP